MRHIGLLKQNNSLIGLLSLHINYKQIVLFVFIGLISLLTQQNCINDLTCWFNTIIVSLLKHIIVVRLIAQKNGLIPLICLKRMSLQTKIDENENLIRLHQSS